MGLIEIANVLISCVQSYMIYNFIYKIWEPRYGYIGSNLLTFIIVAGAYVNGAYIQMKAPTPVAISCGIGMMILYAIFALEGTVFQNIKRGLLYFFAFAMLEAVMYFCEIVLLSFTFVKSLFQNGLTANVVIIRAVYTFAAYFFIIIIQLIKNRKKSRELKLLVGISGVLAVCELTFLFFMFYLISENGVKYIIMITSFSCILVIFGYYLTTEMFYEIIRQEKKKTELERERLEQKYQYDYYILAREYGEKARDLRHDMRNQLQTMQYLLQVEGDEERVEKMLGKLEKKIEAVNVSAANVQTSLEI